MLMKSNDLASSSAILSSSKKAGEIIPQVVSVITERRTGEEKELAFPTNCPECKTQLVKLKAKPSPVAQIMTVRQKYANELFIFASRRAMRIEGLGEALVQQLTSPRTIFNDCTACKY